MKNESLFSESNTATYCPEDDKLRLYVGRVPRDEYEALRAEGWTSTPKQECDFVAVWTPSRRDTAESYAGIIDDEDQTPEERAADRAERFAGYQEKRLGEALQHGDRYDAGPSTHGFQSYARAVRAADRHDKHASRACDAWSKAEYWTTRTAGVISHALHKSAPSVRMGRIKTLEAELRRFENSPHHYGEWIEHTKLRLQYENQMLEAQGGRAATVEMVKGGTWLGGTIAKVSKSPVTKRVTSVSVIVPAVSGWHYKVTNEPGTKYALAQFDTERGESDDYKAPTPESLAKLAEFEAAKKAASAAAPKAPTLINPSLEEAQRLQDLLNAENEKDAWRKMNQGPVSEVCQMTQAQYSKISGGTYSSGEATEICAKGKIPQRSNMYSSAKTAHNAACGPVLFKVRTVSCGGYGARRVVHLTDKPTKPLPAAVWEAFTPATPAEEVTA